MFEGQGQIKKSKKGHHMYAGRPHFGQLWSSTIAIRESKSVFVLLFSIELWSCLLDASHGTP